MQKIFWAIKLEMLLLEFQKIVSWAVVSNAMCHPYGRHVQGRKVA